MAVRYVWSGATGTGDGSSWANAHTNLTAAITASTAGDTFYVAHDHNETGAANTTVTLQFKGSSGNQVPVVTDKIYCVNRAGSVPPVAADLTTGAMVSSNGTGRLNVYGSFYAYGIKWTCGSGATGGAFFEVCVSGDTQIHEKCTFVWGSTAGTLGRFGSGRSILRLINCNGTFNGTGDCFSLQGQEVIIDGPSNTPFITSFPSGYGVAVFGGGSTDDIRKPIIRNCDLSNVPSGGFVALGNTNSGPGLFSFINCKLPGVGGGSLYGYTGGTSLIISARARFLGCNSASGTVTRNEIWWFQCALTTETTIVRTGGASDGLSNYSWKLTPQNSSNSRDEAFETFEGVLWNAAVGSPKTLTIHLVTDNITLNNDECWLEVDYLGTSGTPLATRISSEPANRLTAASAIPTDTAAWTTTGLTTPVKQQLQLTFTPQLAGPIRWRIRYARSTGTVYVCPKADLS